MPKKKAPTNSSNCCPPKRKVFRPGNEYYYCNILDGFSTALRKRFASKYNFITNRIKGALGTNSELENVNYATTSNGDLLYYSCSDVPLLVYENEDYTPNHFLPILPMILINKTLEVYCNPMDVLRKLKRILLGETPIPMLIPCFNNSTEFAYIFTENEIVFDTRINEKENITIIHEFPKTTTYINWKRDEIPESKNMLNTCFSKGYENGIQSCRKTVDKKNQTEHRIFFKLFHPITRKVTQYRNLEDIFEEFFTLRLQFYEKKQMYLIGLLQAKIEQMDELLKFGQLNLWSKAEGNTCSDKLESLKKLGCRPDPVICYQRDFCRLNGSKYVQNDNVCTPLPVEEFGDFQYLLNNPISAFLEEEMLIKKLNRELLLKKLETAKTTFGRDLWIQDLNTIEFRFRELEENKRLRKYNLIFNQVLNYYK